MSKYLDFVSSCFTSDVKALEEGIKAGYDINEEGLNLLINTIILGCVSTNDEYLDALLKNGIDINQKSENGRNALFYATSSYCYPERVKKLIDAGININQTDKDGNNALMYMCSNSFRHDNLSSEDVNEAAKRFIYFFRNKPKEDRDEYKYYKSKRIEIANTLIKSGINVTQLNDDNETALDIAFRNAEIDLVRALASRGLQLHKKDVKPNREYSVIGSILNGAPVYLPFALGYLKVKNARRKYIIKKCHTGKKKYC